MAINNFIKKIFVFLIDLNSILDLAVSTKMRTKFSETVDTVSIYQGKLIQYFA